MMDIIRQIKGATTQKKQQSCVNKFVDEYIAALKSFYVQNIKDAEAVYTKYCETKPVRDVFLDFLPALADTELSFSDVMCNAFEKMYNTLTNGKGFGTKSFSVSDKDYEIYKILIWELFICTIAYLRHIEDYKDINGMVATTYFLNLSWQGEAALAKNYCQFRHHSSIVEDYYKPKTEHKDKFTLMGNTLCTEREKLPIFSGEAIAEADLFLYQIKNAFELVEEESGWRETYWFPTCYVYCKTWPAEWMKMRSRKFCQKLFPLFGVSTIEELQTLVSKCVVDREMRYSRSFNPAPAILSCIKLDEIGSVN